MLRAPTWITSATSATSSTSRTSISSVTIGSPVSLLRLLQEPQPLDPEALEGVRRGARLVGAAAQHRGAGLAHAPGDLERLIAALDGAGTGDQGEVLAADADAVDLEHRSARPCGTARRRACTASGSGPGGRRPAPPRAQAPGPSRGRRSPRSRSTPRRWRRARSSRLSATRSTTAPICSSVASGFITIIIVCTCLSILDGEV